MGEEVEIEGICKTLDELESISILSQATEVGGKAQNLQFNLETGKGFFL